VDELDGLEARVHKAGKVIGQLKSENQSLKKTLEFVRLKTQELLARLERRGK
jgi:hypothetical protein